MDESSIPEIDETTVRMGCLQAATSLNELRDKPKESMAEVIADAELCEFYINAGATTTVNCDWRLERTVR